MYCNQTNPDIHSTNPILKLAQIQLHNSRLASKINYALPKKITEFGKQTFAYIGPLIWQNIPTELNH